MIPFRFPFTTATILLALTVLTAGLIWHIDLIQTPLHLLESFERSEFDEILTLLLLIGAGFAVDRAIETRRTRARIEAERLATIGKTMAAVRATVSDFLTQLNLLRDDLRADAKRFSQLEAHMFHQSVEELSSKLNAIDGLKC
ncbi:MAG TPA: hypothetical protein VFT60_10245 [Bryobacteraceae bacterium]|jgi:hypothetical protein|nr:hypothetical protein [Bryobacteraceae bacterium]